MNTFQRRILLVVDGSYQSYETVNYVSGVLPPSSTEIVLLHITSKIPEAFWDLEKDPVWQHKVQVVRGWEIQQEKKIEDFMDRARQVFLDAGFPDSAIRVDVRERKVGIARDIAMESHRGYDAVILGRRGLSTIQELSLGGVASKIVLKVNDLAVWLVGGKPENQKYVVGVDSSKGSSLALDHLIRMTDGLPKKVLLLHVVRKITNGSESFKNPDFEEYQANRMQQAVKEIEPVLAKASEKLEKAGIPAESISTKIITGAITRAGSILEEARSGGYGTIVVGRRGVSTVEDFDMGRVSNKLVQAGRDRAVWIVG